MKLLAFIERSHWDKTAEGDLLSKFKQKKYPNKGIYNKALSWSTKWNIQNNLPSRSNNESAYVLTKTQCLNKKTPELTVLMLIVSNCLWPIFSVNIVNIVLPVSQYTLEIKQLVSAGCIHWHVTCLVNFNKKVNRQSVTCSKSVKQHWKNAVKNIAYHYLTANICLLV